MKNRLSLLVVGNENFAQPIIDSLGFQYDLYIIESNELTSLNVRKIKFDIIFVNTHDLSTKNQFYKLLTPLKSTGFMVLSEISKLSFRSVLDNIIEWVEIVEHNRDIFAFYRKSLEYNSSCREVLQLCSQKEYVNAVTLLSQLEFNYPNDDDIAILKSLIALKLGKTSQVYQDYLDFTQRVNTKNIMYLPQLKIMAGDYFHGFKERKALFEKLNLNRHSLPPSQYEWKGEALENKHIVIWCEFGFGDMLMFSQFAFFFKKYSACKVSIICPHALVDILRSNKDIDYVIDKNNLSSLLKWDYWVYPHDILAFIPLSFSQIPRRIPYLSSNKEKAEKFLPFMQTSKRKVAIVWRGNKTHENDAYRSIHNLDYLEQLLSFDKIEWFSLQKDCNALEKALLEKYHICSFDSELNSFDDTAAILSHMDYLVTVDTSISHLAGGLGIPTLLLLPFAGDWRWGMTGKHSIWYPSMTLFRCNSPLPDWKEPIQDVLQYLDGCV